MWHTGALLYPLLCSGIKAAARYWMICLVLIQCHIMPMSCILQTKQKIILFRLDSYNQYGMDVPTDAEIERKQISHMSSELAAALADLVIFCKDKMLTCIQHSNDFVQITRHVFQRWWNLFWRFSCLGWFWIFFSLDNEICSRIVKLLSVRMKFCQSSPSDWHFSTLLLFVKHGRTWRQQSQNMAKISKSYILPRPTSRGTWCQWSVRNP